MSNYYIYLIILKVIRGAFNFERTIFNIACETTNFKFKRRYLNGILATKKLYL